MTDERADAELVAAALAGEADAFADLVRRYQDYIYATAVGIVSDFDLARDVAQEAFLAAYRSLPRIREPARFGGWLRGIARNISFEALRDIQRARAMREQLQQTAKRGRRTQGHGAAERRERVQLALAGLSPKNREAVSLHYVDGLSYSQIADFLDVTEAAVLGRLQRGRAELRKEISTMVAETFKSNAPDDAFAHRVAHSVAAYSAKGPSTDHIGSPWQQARREHTRAILNAGDEGFQIDVALSQHPRARIRGEAALHFGIRGDERSQQCLLGLMQDASAGVRCGATSWYARIVRPDGKLGHWVDMPATENLSQADRDQISVFLGPVLAMFDDPVWRVRMKAVSALRAYVPLKLPTVERALTNALADPTHRIVHLAARLLHVGCPGCGAPPA